MVLMLQIYQSLPLLVWFIWNTEGYGLTWMSRKGDFQFFHWFNAFNPIFMILVGWGKVSDLRASSGKHGQGIMPSKWWFYPSIEGWSKLIEAGQRYKSPGNDTRPPANSSDTRAKFLDHWTSQQAFKNTLGKALNHYRRLGKASRERAKVPEPGQTHLTPRQSS